MFLPSTKMACGLEATLGTSSPSIHPPGSAGWGETSSGLVLPTSASMSLLLSPVPHGSERGPLLHLDHSAGCAGLSLTVQGSNDKPLCPGRLLYHKGGLSGARPWQLPTPQHSGLQPCSLLSLLVKVLRRWGGV